MGLSIFLAQRRRGDFSASLRLCGKNNGNTKPVAYYPENLFDQPDTINCVYPYLEDSKPET